MEHHFGGTPSCRKVRLQLFHQPLLLFPLSVPSANKELEVGSAEEAETKEWYLEEFRSTRALLENIILCTSFPCHLFQCQAAPAMYPVYGQLNPGLRYVRENQFWGWGERLLVPPDL